MMKRNRDIMPKLIICIQLERNVNLILFSIFIKSHMNSDKNDQGKQLVARRKAKHNPSSKSALTKV